MSTFPRPRRRTAGLPPFAGLVAGRQAAETIFAAVAEQASGLLERIAITVTRFDGKSHQVVEASPMGPAERGQRIWVEPDTLPDRVRTTAQPYRVDDYRLEGDAALAVRFGLVAAVPGCRCCVRAGLEKADGDIEYRAGADRPRAKAPNSSPTWSPPGRPGRQARREIQALADERAALRRVAELSSREATVSEVLDAVANEAARLAGVDFTCVMRFAADGGTEVVGVGRAPAGLSVGMQAPAGGDGAVQRVWPTGQASQVDPLLQMPNWPAVAAKLGVSNSAAAPIRIDSALWGVLVVVARRHSRRTSKRICRTSVNLPVRSLRPRSHGSNC